MKKENKTLKRKIRNLVGALLLGASSFSRAEDFTYGPVTNNVILSPIELTQYLFQATSSGNGYVTGTANNWLDSGTTGTIEAVANEGYKFSNWSGVPAEFSTNNPISLVADGAYTNIVANFIAKTNMVEDVGFSSVKPSGSLVELVIPDTYTNSLYSIYSNTNLLFNTWNEETNNPGNGTNLIFNMSVEDVIKFYRARRFWKE